MLMCRVGLNGKPIPDQLPSELIPPSSRDLDDSVDLVKDLLKHETRSRSPLNVDAPISRLKNRSFNTSSPSLDTNRDATIYKHTDEPPGGFYKPRSRHVDRDAVRSRDNDDSPVADLSDMKRQLANTTHMLERTAQAEASRSKEDEELDQEMNDLRYRVKRVQDDLDYNARPPRTSSKEEERQRLERELLSLMHERIPEVERRTKVREERKEKEKRQWARDRDDRRRYDDSSRNDRRDRSYVRGSDDRDDWDRPYSRGAYDRDRDRNLYRRELSPDGGRGYDYERPRSSTGRSSPPPSSVRDRDYERPRSSAGRSSPPVAPSSVRDRDYERPRSSAGHSAPPQLASSSVRDTPSVPQHPKSALSRPLKNMTAAERQAFIKAEGQRLTQARMAALGITAPASSPVLDTSIGDRLQQEKEEAEAKVKAAEQQAKERKRAREERLDHERSLKEGRMTPVPPAFTPTVTAPPPAPTLKVVPKVAPTPPKPRAPAPPPPRKAVSPAVISPPAPKPPVLVVPSDEIDHEALLRAREVELRKKREEKEAQFQAKLRLLEAEAEEAARQEEERYQAKLQALKAKTDKVPTPPVEQSPPLAPKVPHGSVVQTPPAALPAPVPANSPIPSLTAKSTNPFSRLTKQTSTPSIVNDSSNPWLRPQTAPPPSDLAPSKSPVQNAVKTNYNTAPSSFDDDWDEIKENDDSDASSDDEITQSKSARADIAQLFGTILPRPASAAASAPNTSAPPLPRSPAPPAPISPVAVPSSNGVSALMQSIQTGMKLRPTKTVDRSAPPGLGKVLGDAAPPHISSSVQSASPSIVEPHIPRTIPMVAANSSHRDSVAWYADRAADVGPTPVEIQRLSSTVEDDDEDIYQPSATHIPEILIDEPTTEPISDLMAGIDKSTRKLFFHDQCLFYVRYLFNPEYRVRSLYAFEGDGPENLCVYQSLLPLELRD